MKRTIFLSLFISGFLWASSYARIPLSALHPLPKTEEIFTVGFGPTPKGISPYFNEESFMRVYPNLGPADLLLPPDGKRFWQSGVIVTKDKKVLFWRTCADNFIAIDSEEGTMFYSTSKAELK